MFIAGIADMTIRPSSIAMVAQQWRTIIWTCMKLDHNKN